MSSSTLADLPDVNDLVDITLDSRAEPLAAVIGAVSADTVLLGEPIDRTGRIVVPATGEQGLLVWGGGSNLRQAPIEVLTTNRRPDPVWLVRVTAPAGRCQRRAFVRADVNLPVVVRQADAELEVTAVDLSEGGMRCYTRADNALAVGDSVIAQFSLGRHFTMSATVARLRRGDEEQPLEVGLRLIDVTIADADRIRRYVFSQLLEQRRRGSA